MNFNFTPDKLIFTVKKFDDENDILSKEERKVLDLHPSILDIPMYIVIKSDKLDSLKEFLSQITERNVANYKLVDEYDYNLIIEIFNDDSESENAGILNVEINEEEQLEDDYNGLSITVNIHAHDVDYANNYLLEDGNMIKIMDKHSQYIICDISDESKPVSYIFNNRDK